MATNRCLVRTSGLMAARSDGDEPFLVHTSGLMTPTA